MNNKSETIGFDSYLPVMEQLLEATTTQELVSCFEKFIASFSFSIFALLEIKSISIC